MNVNTATGALADQDLEHAFNPTLQIEWAPASAHVTPVDGSITFRV